MTRRRGLPGAASHFNLAPPPGSFLASRIYIAGRRFHSFDKAPTRRDHGETRRMSGRVLVTGGAGFIGSHIAEAYLKDGWEVVVLDDLSRGQERNIPGPRGSCAPTSARPRLGSCSPPESSTR